MCLTKQRGQLSRRLSRFVSYSSLCAVTQQPLHCFVLALLDRIVQRSVSMLASAVYVGTGTQQRLELLD